MNRSCVVVVLLASLMQAPPLRAAPSDYVFLPSVSYGERELDFKAGSARNPDEPRQSAGSLGFGYGCRSSTSFERLSKGLIQIKRKPTWSVEAHVLVVQ